MKPPAGISRMMLSRCSRRERALFAACRVPVNTSLSPQHADRRSGNAASLVPCMDPCMHLISIDLGPVADLAAAHGATAECFETYPLWVSAVRPRSKASTRA